MHTKGKRLDANEFGILPNSILDVKFPFNAGD